MSANSIPKPQLDVIETSADGKSGRKAVGGTIAAGEAILKG